MSVGDMCASSDGDRQTTGLQRDALLAEGVDDPRLYKDDASSARAARPGLPGGAERGGTKSAVC